MKERPIIMSAPMVRAMLSGAKSQTRRAVKLPKHVLEFLGDPGRAWIKYGGFGGQPGHSGPGAYVTDEEYSEEGSAHVPCPYGVPGDRLWVRETWSHDAPDLATCRAAHEDVCNGIGYGPYYRATEVAPDTLRWRPAIYMPRWASRITLEVTGVRVEQLHDISEEDAKAEGIESGSVESAVEKYAWLWGQINGAASWAANVWVWVISFRRLADAREEA